MTAVGVVSLIILLAFPPALAKEKYDVGQERGIISISFLGGQNEFRLLNNDSTWAGYTGMSYGLGIQIGILSVFGNSNLQFFLDSVWTGSKGASDSVQTIQQQDLNYGLKFYPFKFMYFAAGLGTSTNKISANGKTDEVKVPTNVFGTGFEMSISSSWTAGIQAWYKSGVIKKQDSTYLSSNSAIEGVNASLIFIWSPPMTIVNYKN